MEKKFISVFTGEVVLNEKDYGVMLQEEIRKHDKLYSLNKPIISDGEYDNLYFELLQLEERNPEIRNSDSPTQNVIEIIVDGLSKVKHSEFMGSQEKVNDRDGIIKFLDTTPEGSKYLVEYKLDGLTIVLKYRNGLLIQAITRGDGTIGEDVTHTIKTMSNIPNRINFKGYLELRMEAILPLKEFDRINVDGEYSNPRNLVSGTIRQLSSKVASERGLLGIIFDVIKIEDKTFETDSEQFKFIKDLGFTTVHAKFFEDKEELVDYCLGFSEKDRGLLEYMIDGLVIKIDNLEDRQTMGYRSKSPKWSVAFKFKSQDATTYLRAVEWNVGRTGQISPVAVFDEVDIDNVKITRATLHNMDYIRDRDLKINDKIIVVRANDVIPKVMQRILSERGKDIEDIVEPTKCPCCMSKLVHEGANIFCRNEECDTQSVNKLIAWASRARMNINSLGKEVILQLFEAELISSIPDIYKIKDAEEAFIQLPRLGKKTFDNVVLSIEESKKAPLEKVLYGFSIPNIGETASKELVKHYNDIQEIIDEAKDKDSFIEKVIEFKDFGKKMTESLYTFFSDQTNVDMITSLKDLGMIMKVVKDEVVVDRKFEGLRFCVTGTLSQKRDYFKDIIESLGGDVSGSVSKKTDYLLAGDKAGSKLDKAIEIGVKVLDEEAFNNLVK